MIKKCSSRMYVYGQVDGHQFVDVIMADSLEASSPGAMKMIMSKNNSFAVYPTKDCNLAKSRNFVVEFY